MRQCAPLGIFVASGDSAGAGVGVTPDGYRFCTDEWLVVEYVDVLTPLDLDRIEQRLDAFGEWFARVVIEGGSYDRTAAMEDYRLLAADQMRLLVQARRAYRDWIESCR